MISFSLLHQNIQIKIQTDVQVEVKLFLKLQIINFGFFLFKLLFFSVELNIKKNYIYQYKYIYNILYVLYIVYIDIWYVDRQIDR